MEYLDSNGRTVWELNPNDPGAKQNWGAGVLYLDDPDTTSNNNITSQTYDLVFEMKGSAIGVEAAAGPYSSNSNTTTELFPASSTWVKRTLTLTGNYSVNTLSFFATAEQGGPVYLDKIRFVPKDRNW